MSNCGAEARKTAEIPLRLAHLLLIKAYLILATVIPLADGADMEVTNKMIDRHFKANATFLRRALWRLSAWLKHQAA